MNKSLIFIAFISSLLLIHLNLIAQTERLVDDDSRYGAIARDYLQKPGKYDGQNSIQGLGEGTWDLKFTERNISGDTSFGRSVACVGDVNGDGYNDVLVGACSYNDYFGRAYLYYGGAVMDTVADLVMTGEIPEGQFGISVAGAGDVNKDGFADMVITTDIALTTDWARFVYIYYGGPSLDNIADLVLTQEEEPYFGTQVAGAGDVNGDGFDDVMVAAMEYDNETGHVFFYFGSVTMDSSVDLVLSGDTTQDGYATIINGVGDVNNDGYADVMVGAYLMNNSTGRAYLYYGGPDMDASADVIFNGKHEKDSYGGSVTGIGDINEDGYDDILVGACGYNMNNGQVYLYYGGTSMDTTADIILSGETGHYNFGANVAGAGDVNNDGFADILVGYRFKDEINLYLGGNFIDNVPNAVFYGITIGRGFGRCTENSHDLNNDGFADVLTGSFSYYSRGHVDIFYGSLVIDTQVDCILKGEAVKNEFGYCVTGAGDVNGDGYKDVLIGAWAYNGNAGRAYLYYGGQSMDTVADVIITGDKSGNKFGFSVSGAGDVNGDGFDDILVGAPLWSEEYDQTGRVYLYYGGAQMDSSADIIMTGDKCEYSECERYQDGFGYTLAGAGDVNGDGYADFLVGNSIFSDFGTKVVLFYGGPDKDNIADFILTGERKDSEYGYESIAGVGDVNGDGFDDILIGAKEYGYVDNIKGYGEFVMYGRAYLYYGSGTFDSVADVIFTGQTPWEQFGSRVAGAGDVNNDGYADLLVRSARLPAVFLFLGGTEMDNIADVTLPGEQYGGNSHFGFSMTGVGDVNYDCYDDVLVSAYGTETSSGQLLLYYGNVVMDSIPDEIIYGEKDNKLGYSVARTGDVNGDGSSDFIVGAPMIGRYYYREQNNDFGKVTEIGDYYNGAAYLYFGSRSTGIAEPGTTPVGFPKTVQLQNNYPNPFNPATTITFELTEWANVEIAIFDITGRTVKTLLHERRGNGEHNISWDGRDDAGLPVSSGVYLCKLSTDRGYTETKKMTLVK
ncbi:MAG TPA: FG-GAP-like repeat-containing protein [bacterium]|nr:FG-GAP-like repeat-containing protein [bacterium]HPN45450.1 FG-GAP-like repeat-containing protein [bacterium]